MANTGSIVLHSMPSSYAARRLEKIFGRSYSLALLLTGTEMSVNAFSQLSSYKPLFFWPLISFTLFSIVGMAISNWFFSGGRRWYVLHFASVTINIAFWVFEVQPAALPLEHAPYVWWSLGLAALSASFGLRKALAGAAILILPVAYGLLRTSAFGGDASIDRTIEDCLYTFLFSGTFAALFELMRFRALEQDLANDKLRDAAVAQASQGSRERERLRLASVVYNQVIVALNSALDAHTPEQRENAARLAEASITRLKGYSTESTGTDPIIPADALFSSIEELVATQHPGFKLYSSVQSQVWVPAEVADALTQATLQAVTNSQIHAGGERVLRELRLKAEGNQIKLVVRDEGVGFRPSRVPKNRLGIRTIIFRQLESVGATAHIDSRPGEGTTVVLEWSANE
jgi:signal transduction histidine kinase